MNNRILTSILILVVCPFLLRAQEEDIENLLNEEIINTNPVYKPVIGIGSGVFNFYGDVRNNYINPVIGNFGYKLNVSTFLDRKKYFTVNLLFIYGKISANEKSTSDLERNLNFQSDLVNFGLSVEYNFDHFIKRNKSIRPFISAGIENIQFSPKGDLYNSDGDLYHYWTDGSIRLQPEMSSPPDADIMHRDFDYETDLRQRERDLHGLGDYSKNTFAIPVDVGLNFRISERISCKLGTSLHFTLTDYMDNVSSKGTSVKGKKGNDIFSYNYVSLNFDLFSEPKTLIVEKMFAEYEFDEVMLDDEDGDFILDGVDQCPGTPYGVSVDTLGCPLDGDGDGVADYLDEEKNTRPGAWVNEKGVTVSEVEYLSLLMNRKDAMRRRDVIDYFNTIGKGYEPKKVEEIPDKFLDLDLDNDAYISFEELLLAIDKYFDNQLNLTVEDIYELNNFFFNQ